MKCPLASKEATRRMRAIADRGPDKLDDAIAQLPDTHRIKRTKNPGLARAQYILEFGDPRLDVGLKKSTGN